MNDDSRTDLLRRRLPELVELEELHLATRGVGTVRVEEEIQLGELIFPIYSFSFGSSDGSHPVVLFVGGVHGLERVGTNVVISYLKTVLELVQWDLGLQHLLRHCRMVFVPLLNPAGMFAKSRANSNGVDLMRNAPLDAVDVPNIRWVSGHRISARLPWFRGYEGAPMEKEAETLIRIVRRELFQSQFSMALDLHSGFGLVDRLWFPYAYSRAPFDRLDLMVALKSRLDRSLPNHFYLMEPQSRQYVTHGDLWDHLYLLHRQSCRGQVFLPMTLEMGSWLWIKKNPKQVFNALGIFNPMMPHRLQRTLRRHLGLLDFIFRATVSHKNWVPESGDKMAAYTQHGQSLWYSAGPLY